MPTSSDIPSAVSLPPEPELKGQKRNGSPSLIVACSKTLSKRQCGLGQSDTLLEVEKAFHAYHELSTHDAHPVSENVVDNILERNVSLNSFAS